MGDEREARQAMVCPARVEYRGVSQAAHSADVSLGGAFLTGVTDVSEGAPVRVSLELPNGLLEVAAQVRWVRLRAMSPAEPAGCGVHWVDLDAEDRAGLEEALTLLPRWSE